MLTAFPTNCLTAKEALTYSKPILIASGKYGLSVLRVEADAWYLKNLDLSVDNAIDELLYADGETTASFSKRL